MNATLFGNEKSDIVLIQMVDEHELSTLGQEMEILRGLTDKDFCLVAICVNNWNVDLSPWSAPPVYGNEPFGSGADNTLLWVRSNVIQGLEKADEGKRQYILGGYSLAGLFALYSAYKTDIFVAVAAVSPSVWFPGFTQFAEETQILTNQVYLSLGDREERSKNKILASVGDCIRKLEAQYKESIDVTLEWNEGNHFKNPEERMAKGFAHLMNTPFPQK